MIETFSHSGLAELFQTGKSAKLNQNLIARIKRRLSALDAATDLRFLNQPGFDLHQLNTKPLRYSIHVNGPWCITFEWQDGNALRVDLEQYH